METDCSASEPYALRALGDSMAPEFEDGAVIVVDPAGVIENGCYVVAMYQGEYIFRQWIVEDGRCLLKPLNDRYETVEVAGPAAVKGVVVQKAGRTRAERKHYY